MHYSVRDRAVVALGETRPSSSWARSLNACARATGTVWATPGCNRRLLAPGPAPYAAGRLARMGQSQRQVRGRYLTEYPSPSRRPTVHGEPGLLLLRGGRRCCAAPAVPRRRSAGGFARAPRPRQLPRQCRRRRRPLRPRSHPAPRRHAGAVLAPVAGVGARPPAVAVAASQGSNEHLPRTAHCIAGGLVVLRSFRRPPLAG